MIFKNDINAIQLFFEIANKEDELLKYKFDITKDKVTFLDTGIYKGKRFENEKSWISKRIVNQQKLTSVYIKLLITLLPHSKVS